MLATLGAMAAALGSSGTPMAACPPSTLSSRQQTTAQAQAARNAYAAFFFTGHGSFWGSAFHVERFIDAVKTSSDAAATERTGRRSNATVLIDVGAAPYNTVGGDISHTLTFLKHWPAESGATILGYEPGVAPFRRLVSYVSKASGRPAHPRGGDARPLPTPGLAAQRTAAGTHVIRDAADAFDWIVLRNSPLSDEERTATIAAQPFAGDNTASLEQHYQGNRRGARVVRTITIDSELRLRGLTSADVLILKVRRGVTLTLTLPV
jgi:hypothetical protein